MKSEFSVLGSFASGSIFITKLNSSYHSYFRINTITDRTCLISLMSEPVEYDADLINSKSDKDNFSINQDLSKDFLEYLKNDDTVEYLVLDTFNDMKFNCFRLGENSFITNSNLLRKTDYYTQIKDSPQIGMHKNFDEYFDLWKRACDEFFDFMKIHRPDVIIILNLARYSYEYINENDEIEIFDYNEGVVKDNELKAVLDYYILENHDVEVLLFKDNYLDENHIYGLNYTHYEEKYYNDKNRQLNKIIERNRLYDFDDAANVKLRELERKELLFKRAYDKLKK